MLTLTLIWFGLSLCAVAIGLLRPERPDDSGAFRLSDAVLSLMLLPLLALLGVGLLIAFAVYCWDKSAEQRL